MDSKGPVRTEEDKLGQKRTNKGIKGLLRTSVKGQVRTEKDYLGHKRTSKDIKGQVTTEKD